MTNKLLQCVWFAMLPMLGAGCVPAKEILLYPQSELYEVNNEIVNQDLADKKAVITFLSRERRVGQHLSIVNDTLKWREEGSGLAYEDALAEIRMISYQERSADTIVGLLMGIVLGSSLGSAYHARHYENREGSILVGTTSGIVLGYGAFRLLSEKNERTRYIVIHE